MDKKDRSWQGLPQPLGPSATGFYYPVPPALAGRVAAVHFCESYSVPDEGEESVFLGAHATISFAEVQRGIRGLFLEPAEEQDARRIFWNTVTIEMIPGELVDDRTGPQDLLRDPDYDERGTRITWGLSTGLREEAMFSLYDELNTALWLVENDLEDLYHIPAVRLFLPCRDRDRRNWEAAFRQIRSLCGERESRKPVIPATSFVEARLRQRLLWLLKQRGEPPHEAKRLVQERYCATKYGTREVSGLSALGLLPRPRFFRNRNLPLVTAVYNYGDQRDMIVVNLDDLTMMPAPLEVTADGIPWYENADHKAALEEINAETFSLFIVAAGMENPHIFA